MNSATNNLENDHVHILRLLDVMEAISKLDKVDSGDLEAIVGLIKNYADGFHHSKEENKFFPFLVKKGFSYQQGPVAVMLNEHKLGRGFVKGMEEGLSHYKKGDENSLALIYKNMQGYISLLRNHIAKENNVLFRMADKVLSENEQETLLQEFAGIENTQSNGKPEIEYITAIEKLESQYC